MPVFTAAAVAIGAAIATTTFATVAAAVVTTSVAIGVTGLAVTAVGMITKNEDLLKAGKIMGYVGMAGGLAGGLIGGVGGMASGGGFLEGAGQAFTDASTHLSQAWDNGVGSIFSSGEAQAVAGEAGAAAQPAGLQGIPNGIDPTAATTPKLTESAASVGQKGLVEQELGRQAVQGTQGNLGASQLNAGITPAPTATPVAPVSAPMSTPVSMPGTNAPPLPITTDVTNTINQVGQVGAGTVLAPGGVNPAPATPGLFDGISKGWADLPEWVKYSMMTTGGQGVSGALSGWFAGASAEERLEFERLQNQQRQNQVDYLNRNNQYAPLLQFGR